jgi:hypothetical protein
MEINLINNAPVYPADVSKTSSQKVDETAAAAQQAEQVAAPATQEPDGFEKRPFQVAAVEDLVGPFKFSVVSNNGGVTDVKTGNLQNLVSSMLGQQANVAGAANGQLSLIIDQAQQDKAKAAIAEDGYWGAEQTSTRLLDFAKALGGADADASKIEELRDATMKGYEAIADMFGGKLPQVTADTYDRVMAGFDAWVNEANGGAEVVEGAENAEAVQPGETVVE